MTQVRDAPPPDSVHAVLNEVFADPKYDWDVARSPLQFFIDAYRRLMYWFSVMETEHPGVYWAVLGVMIVLVIAILTHFGYLIWKALTYRAPERLASATKPAVRRDAGWYLAEARRLADQGHRAEALAARFRALVLQLEHRNAVRFHPSKTPAEYVREADLSGEQRSTLAELVSDLYRHLFAGAPVSDDDLTLFDSRAAQLVESHATH